MNEDKLFATRHSLAHIMASAITRLWPSAKLGVGPVIENGFYYDIDLGDIKISEDDFAKIEKEMRSIISENQEFVRSSRPIDEAISWAGNSGQPYKLELLNDLKREGTTVAKDLDAKELGLSSDGDSKVDEVSFYINGDFTDLCRGPHVVNTSDIDPKSFRLLRVAGAYWRGNEKNPQMQRLYGVAFESKDKLDEYLDMIEEAKKRDHRKLGQELDLFVFSELVGPGLPLWTPRGTILKNKLDEFVQELRDEVGFQQVSIPHLTKKDLYERSGHWMKFKDELFRMTTREGHEFAMKPMNCPHHTQIYSSQPRSHRSLPIRYRDTTMVYRDEQSGELGGLSRVRSITQDDAHIFCRADQVESEARSLWGVIEKFYGTCGFEQFKVRLSTHDPANMEAYSGSEDKWESTVRQLRTIIENKVGSDYSVGVGEAAFYGPKIDFMAKDAIGREHQLATIQLDFNQPESFDLTCINENGDNERIIMLHCAVMGSHERFLSVYIEHTAGRFPVWCAPEQLRIIKVKDDPAVDGFANTVLSVAKEYGIRATLDDSNNSVGKKIRNAELWKVPYSVVIGEKESSTHELSVRVRSDFAVDGRPDTSLSVDQLMKSISNEVRSRVTKSSL